MYVHAHNDVRMIHACIHNSDAYMSKGGDTSVRMISLPTRVNMCVLVSAYVVLMQHTHTYIYIYVSVYVMYSCLHMHEYAYI